MHEELGHIEAMRKCRVFEEAYRDLAVTHSCLGHMNSIRVWIGNAAARVLAMLEGDDEVEGEPPEAV